MSFSRYLGLSGVVAVTTVLTIFGLASFAQDSATLVQQPVVDRLAEFMRTAMTVVGFPALVAVIWRMGSRGGKLDEWVQTTSKLLAAHQETLVDHGNQISRLDERTK